MKAADPLTGDGTKLFHPRQDDLMAYLLERLTDEEIRELEPVLRVDLAPESIG